MQRKPQGGKAPHVSAVELLISPAPIDYPWALSFMERRVQDIHQGRAAEALWLLEHPPIYTAGTSARAEDDLGTHPFPVYQTGRGGRLTYHGPGQRVAYLMVDLAPRGRDVRAFVSALETWVAAALSEFSLSARAHADRVGLWVNTPDGEAKIAALGLRLKKWVSLHGVAINVNPDLDPFRGIVPCGLADHGVTSLEQLGLPVAMTDLDVALIKHFDSVFGAPLTPARRPRI